MRSTFAAAVCAVLLATGCAGPSETITQDTFQALEKVAGGDYSDLGPRSGVAKQVRKVWCAAVADGDLEAVVALLGEPDDVRGRRHSWRFDMVTLGVRLDRQGRVAGSVVRVAPHAPVGAGDAFVCP